MNSLIPANALDRHIGFLGMTGSGKTSAAKTAIIEPALAAGERVIIIDPTSAYWGLRINADGKRKGYQIYVFGGDRGDYPLRARDAEMLAEAFGTSSDSAVFDTSLIDRNRPRQRNRVRQSVLRHKMNGVIYSLGFPGLSDNRYIGSARNLNNRMKAHAHLLRKGTHHSRALQNAANKYGVHNIKVEILECGLEESVLIGREQTWLDRFSGRLYNRSPTAASRLGAKMSLEARAKISASLKGNKYRKGIPHDAASRKAISDGVRLANAEGRRRKPRPCPENLSEFNRAIKAGEIIAPWAKPARNAEILTHYSQSRSMVETGAKFGITQSSVSYVVRKLLKTPKGKRGKPCQNI